MRFYTKTSLALLCLLVSVTLQSKAQYIISAAVGGNYSPENKPATSVAIHNSIGVTTDVAGNIYFCDTDNHRIRKIDVMTGIITTIAGVGRRGFSGDGASANLAELAGPNGITMDAAGNIYFCDTYNYRIRKINSITGIITTIAGRTFSEHGGDGGLAINASFSRPIDLTINSKGDLFIVEDIGSRVRKIDAATGIITTIAGNGVQGYSGDGGLAINAQFIFLSSISIDKQDNIYLLDQSGHRVRKIDAATGIITTIAGNGVQGYSGDGGLAINAQINAGKGLTLDNSGNIYIVDQNNHCIRKVDSATGFISTIAGTGVQGYSGDGGLATTAQLRLPSRVTVDNTGNIYIQDNFNYRIRKVNVSTGFISTIAGNGSKGYLSGYSGDGGLAITAQLNVPINLTTDNSGNLYIADQDNHRIRKVNVSTGFISTIAGIGMAGFSGDGSHAATRQLNAPAGLATDSHGNVYVADSRNHRIRKINVSTGFISTIAGTGIAGFSGDEGPASMAMIKTPKALVIDSNDNLYFWDEGNHRLRKVDGTSGNIHTIAGNGQWGSTGDGSLAIGASFNYPRDFTLDPSGNIYIADTQNNRIRKISATTGIVTTIAGIGAQGYSGDGGQANQTRLFYPSGIVIDKRGNIVFSDNANHRIRKIDASTGIISTIAGNGLQGYSGDGGPASQAKIIAPYGLTIDQEESLYFSNPYNHTIRKLSAAANISVKQGTNLILNNKVEVFETVNQEGSSSQRFTIENTGLIPLSINTITVDGGFTLTPHTLTSLSPGNSMNITVKMNTTTSGTKIGKLVIQSNDLEDSTYTIHLAGKVKSRQYIQFNSLPVKKYDDQSFRLTASSSSGLYVKYESSDENVATIKGDFLEIKGIGSVNITASQAGDGDFEAAKSVTQRLIVKKGEQTISFDLGSHASKTYGNTSFSITTIKGKSGNPVKFSSSDAKIVSVSGNTFSINGAGRVTIIAYQEGNNLYNAASTVSRLLIVKKAPLVVKPRDQRRIIGQSNPSFILEYTGFIGNDKKEDLDTLPMAMSPADKTSPVGDYDVVASGGLDNNYFFKYQKGTLSIREKALLIVTAHHKRRKFGESNPSFTFSYTGFTEGDNPSILDKAPTAITNAKKSSPVGTYKIIPSGGSDDKYVFEYRQGTLIIDKAPQKISFTLGGDSLKSISDSEFQLQAVGGNSGNNIVFTSSNPNVILIQGNIVQIKGVGSVSITASQAGNDNYLAAQDIKRTLIIRSTVTGAEENFLKAKLLLYPNPVTNYLHIKLALPLSNPLRSLKVSIVLYNSLGNKALMQKDLLLKDKALIIPVANFPMGMYLLKIKLGKEVLRRRIVKK